MDIEKRAKKSKSKLTFSCFLFKFWTFWRFTKNDTIAKDLGKNDVTTHVDRAPPTLTSSSTTLKRHLIQDAKWLHVVTLYILFETQDPQNHTLHIHSRLGKTKEYPSPPYQNIVQNYSETSGIQATAAVYHRSDIITKEPLRLVNSMKCDKPNIIRKKLAFFSIFVCDTIT